MKAFTVRYVHKISPRADDIFPIGKTPRPIELSSKDLENKNTLAAALRRMGVLSSGVRLRGIRHDSGKIIAFPSASVWWSLILSPVGGG